MCVYLCAGQAFEAYAREVEAGALGLDSDVDLLKCAALICRATAYPHVEVADIQMQVRTALGSSWEIACLCMMQSMQGDQVTVGFQAFLALQKDLGANRNVWWSVT
jgi:hypothetical protein